MPTAFEKALDTLYADPNHARDAKYRPLSGAGFDVRVIETVEAPAEGSIGHIRVRASAAGQAAAKTVRVRKSQVTEPVRGDAIELADGISYAVREFELDEEGLEWSLALGRAAA